MSLTLSTTLHPFPPSYTVYQFSMCFVVTCSYTDVMYFIIIHSLTFFPSFPPLLVTSNSLTFGNTFCVYLYVYMIMLVFVLDLTSTYERKHVTFVFLNLANFT
jgi:hypothetical protein